MKSERGAPNIRKFNAVRTEKNLHLIEEGLRECQRRRLQFKSIGLLATYISDRSGIHRTTLQRNANYKILLAQYVRSQPGAATSVSDEVDDAFILKAKIAIAQAELGVLRKEVTRLNAQLVRISAAKESSVAKSKSEVEFANLCMLLSLVLVRAETFVVDTKARVLVDLSAKPTDRIVGGERRAADYVDWLVRNASLPVVSDVKRC